MGQEGDQAERDRLRAAIVNTILSDDDAVTSNIHLTDTHRKKLEVAFLAKLRYQSMDDRELAISEAHETTFRWVFSRVEPQTAEWSSFADWLESDGQVYWITGKAGAGKSTLMKFLTQPNQSSQGESRCAKYLRRWAGEQRLIMATFYFWATGSTAQKSHAGLFKTLLFDMLKEFPEAIPFTSPKRWEVLSLFNEDPMELTERDLRSMFKRAVQHISSEAKIILFVDGLDEFDGNSDLLISTMRDAIAESSSIKLCVASRPWNEFQQAFKGKPSLRLQDLTRSDIKSYVEAMFNQNLRFLALRDDGAEVADELINSVVSKASGVFLWVRIVVSSLLTGLNHADRVSDLQRRLDRLPEDLENLYERILDDIDPFYLQHAAEYFLLMEACPEPPPALLFSFADEEKLLDLPSSLLSSDHQEDLFKRVRDIAIRLNSRCKGLLEVVGNVDEDSVSATTVFLYPGPKIQYLHKTVREYVDKQRKKGKLARDLVDSYDANLKILYANIVTLSRCPPSHWKVSDWAHWLRGVMYHAAEVRAHSTQELVRGLDRLLAEISAHGLSGASHRRSFFGFDKYGFDAMGPELKYLCFAIECGVAGYMNAKLNQGCSVLFSKRGLEGQNYYEHPSHQLGLRFLSFVKRSTSRSEDTTTVPYPLLQVPFLMDSPLPSNTKLNIVTALLNKGADPNQQFKFRPHGRGPVPTAWRLLVGEITRVFLTRSSSETLWANLGKMARLMIDHGAKVDSTNVEAGLRLGAVTLIHINRKNPSVSWLSDNDVEYTLSQSGCLLQKAVFSALRKLKDDKSSTKIEFDGEHRQYQGTGRVELFGAGREIPVFTRSQFASAPLSSLHSRFRSLLRPYSKTSLNVNEFIEGYPPLDRSRGADLFGRKYEVDFVMRQDGSV